MIEPFEYEKTRTQTSIGESSVKNDRLDTTVLDKQLNNLNNFKSKSEYQSFLEAQRPYTEKHQKSMGRVSDMNKHKAFYQDEAIATRGSMVSDYETRGEGDVLNRENASVLIGRYLDNEVRYVPPQMMTVDSIDNIRISEPALQPGITFIDSRKNMATTFQ